MCGFTTDFHGIRHGFSHYCVYQCHVLCYLCLLWWVKQVIINLSEAVRRFIGVGVADFVKLSVIICEICEELNHQPVIFSISEAVQRFIAAGIA